MGIFSKDEPEIVEIRGRPFRCLACENDTFYQRRAQLHSGVATFFNLEWTSPTCVCVICSAWGTFTGSLHRNEHGLVVRSFGGLRRCWLTRAWSWRR